MPLLALERTYGLTPEVRVIANAWRATEGDFAVYAKGAPEDIVKLCALNAQMTADVAANVDRLAETGIRVLGVASAHVRGSLPDNQTGISFRYLGLIGFTDPLRADVPDAIEACRKAGIRVIMITGDYPKTARVIADQAGIPSGQIVSGDQISKLTETELRDTIRSANVFARTRPTQKLRLVEALKANGEIVAMTGDGVNDAPALKAAHIGVAMGGRGTDVAREASSIVLLHDDFGSLVKTIRLGRRIYDNLRKAMVYIVAVHIPIAGLALLPLLLGLPLILTPIHIAFLEMVIDPACSIVFEAEPEEDDVMTRLPRDPAASLVPPHLLLWSLLQGAVALLVTAAAIYLGQGMPEQDLRALAVTTLVGANLVLIFVNRSFDGSMITELSRTNRSLWLLLAAVGIVLGFALFSSVGRALFHFGPMHADDLAVCATLGLGMFGVLNLLKRKWRSVYQ